MNEVVLIVEVMLMCHMDDRLATRYYVVGSLLRF